MWKRAVCVCSFLRQNHREVAPQAIQALQFHASCTYRHPRSGDRGPARNYRKKVAKQLRAENSEKMPGINASGPKKTGRRKEEGAVDIAAILQGFRKVEQQQQLGETERGAEDKDRVTLDQLLSEIEVHIPTKEEVQKRLGMSQRITPLQREPKLSGSRGTVPPTHFMDHRAGKRLGIFEYPKPGQKVMPPHEPTLEEQDVAERMESLTMLKPRTRFEEMLQPKYPRHFPIDNEDYQTEEQSVGFEDHVLLDHLLEGFPTRGPVRHFMELVVTGLSRNPNYSAKEKRDYVLRFKTYFSQFSPEELQSVPVTRKEVAIQ